MRAAVACLIAGLAAVVAGPGGAGPRDAVACVQEQLIRLEQEPGQADGVMGPRTRDAAQAWLMAQPFATQEKFPTLRRRTALQWCRQLGLHDRDLIGAWPGMRPFSITTDRTGEDIKRKLLTRTFRDAQVFFKQRYNVQIAAHIEIVGSDNLRDLRRHTRKARARIANGRSYPPVHERHCDTTSSRAFASPNLIGICWFRDAGHNEVWLNGGGDGTDAIMVHEMMHAIQYEYANQMPHRRAADGDWIFGPEWLAEGSAEYLADVYRVEDLGLREFPLRSIFDWAHRSDVTLASLRNDMGEDLEDTYLVSQAAAHVLAKRFGDQALFDYWLTLGRLEDRDAAFEATFGMPQDQFERDFEVIRKRYGDFEAYIAGEDVVSSATGDPASEAELNK